LNISEPSELSSYISYIIHVWVLYAPIMVSYSAWPTTASRGQCWLFSMHLHASCFVCVCVFLLKNFIKHHAFLAIMFHVFKFLFPLNTMHLSPSCFVFFFSFEHHAFVIFMLHDFYLFIYSFLWMPCICDLHVSCYLFISFFLWTPCIWGGGSDTWHHWLILFGCMSYDNGKYDNWS
jgi:hypothetical protein